MHVFEELLSSFSVNLSSIALGLRHGIIPYTDL
jgi:hypothetical protein